MTEARNFTFIVLTYNHSNFILEHLESIKYIVENFANDIAVSVIVADDASRDNTVDLINFWFSINSHLFRSVKVLTDGINRGTCKNLTLALENLCTDYCKITAGDDVYSFENLFREVEKLDDNHILSGLPLNLIGETITAPHFDLFNLFATNIIYQKSQYIARLQGINFFNSPSIVYSVNALTNKTITNFVEQFAVTEDYPLQIKMAELYIPLRFVQTDKILIYYRRTANSTYIVKNEQFNRDKVRIFKYLIESENSNLRRMILRNRLYCYGLERRYLKKAFNLSFYLYGFGVLINLISILKKFKKLDMQLTKHKDHYRQIALKARNCLH